MSGLISRLFSIADLTEHELRDLLLAAERIDNHIRVHGYAPPLLRGKCLAMVFDETSLRTRSAFERAMIDLGGHAIHYRGEEIRIGRHASKQEHLPDLVNVLGGFNDAVLSRIYDHDLQVEFCRLSPVPFINGMCDREHPTQALCDFLTIQRQFGRIHDIKIAFIGDATNVALSLAQCAGLAGAQFVIATPEEWRLPRQKTQSLRGFQETSDPRQAADGADVIVADVWVPMNKAADADRRRRRLAPYRITRSLMALAKPNAIFLHNLPVTRGDEVDAEVIDGPQSAIYSEAIARLHIARALMLAVLRPDWRACSASLTDAGRASTR